MSKQRWQARQPQQGFEGRHTGRPLVLTGQALAQEAHLTVPRRRPLLTARQGTSDMPHQLLVASLLVADQLGVVPLATLAAGAIPDCADRPLVAVLRRFSWLLQSPFSELADFCLFLRRKFSVRGGPVPGQLFRNEVCFLVCAQNITIF